MRPLTLHPLRTARLINVSLGFMLLLIVMWNSFFLFPQYVGPKISKRDFLFESITVVVVTIGAAIVAATTRHRIRSFGSNSVELYWSFLWFKIGRKIYSKDELILSMTQRPDRYFSIDLSYKDKHLVHELIPTQSEAEGFMNYLKTNLEI